MCKRIGLDVDGVLARWVPDFCRKLSLLATRDLFPTWPYDPPCWDFAERLGYTEEEIDATWRSIKSSPHFWRELESYPDIFRPLRQLNDLVLHGELDLYFISARPGVFAKQQTEQWLAVYVDNPTVLMSSDKAKCCTALKLDAYLDDRDKNARNVAQRTETRSYLLNRSWNVGPMPIEVIRVQSLEEFMKLEELW